ncbi:hypothetical protein Lfu02_70800 [Longispora fulva]|uniref:Uncharacterized protein n=1 Tax=Longispora fulva TaxID=619741 RepID=A0A8J7GDD1_9ACTN|nr:hypothetical protein [Longispora fulva]MBG6134377.1 hypothetical protein [Longispora fulva]GIG62708.1 hypothetical protein Lfu02_70800 [Longispora fulva]
MTNERTDETGWRRRWVIATCAALVLAAVGDAGPEIVASRSLVAGYDGPGPLIYLGFAAMVAMVRWWRFTPLLAVVMSAFFLVGGFADADFASRLTTPTGVASAGAWLQMLSFAAAIVCGTASVRWRRARPTVNS